MLRKIKVKIKKTQKGMVHWAVNYTGTETRISRYLIHWLKSVKYFI